MEPKSPTIQARQLVYRALADLGITDPGPCTEMILIRDSFCVGRRFSFDSVGAVWTEANAKIEFYDTEGQLLKTISIEQQVDLKKAA